MTSSEMSTSFWLALDGLLRQHPRGAARQSLRARKVGCSPTTYSLKVHGRRLPRRPDLAPISKALLLLAPDLPLSFHLFPYKGRLYLLLYV